ncbi:uncharacterized protein LOC111243976 [Varroa destructor]|uniref:Uncharacterized protein n=1 Tax=Varroa destructor TaxID=109461 RepID=A0A7M7J4X2_VARDE|nr:uncharacterized protein LOC111243976 [Varroa destructor]
MTNNPSSRTADNGEPGGVVTNQSRKLEADDSKRAQWSKLLYLVSPGDDRPSSTGQRGLTRKDNRYATSNGASNGGCVTRSHDASSETAGSCGSGEGKTRIVTTRIVYKTITRPSGIDGTLNPSRRDHANSAVPPGLSATLPLGVDPTIINPIPKPKRHVSLPGTVIAINSESGISIMSDTGNTPPQNYTTTATTVSSESETTTSRLLRNRLPKPGRLYKTAKGVTHSKSMSALSALRGAGAKLAHHLTSIARSREVSPARAPDNLSTSTLNSEFKACAFSYRVNEDLEVDLLGEITDEFSRRAREAMVSTSNQRATPAEQTIKTERVRSSTALRQGLQPRAGCSHDTPRRASVIARLIFTPLASTEVDSGLPSYGPGPSQVPPEIAQKSSSFPASGRTFRERPPSSSRTNPMIANSADAKRLSRLIYRGGVGGAPDMQLHHRHQALGPSLLQALEGYRRSSPSPSPAYPLSCCSSSSRGSSPVSHSQLSVTPSEVGSDFYIQGRRRFRRAKTDLGPGGSAQGPQPARLTEREIAKRAQHGPRQVRKLLSEIDASSDTSSIKSHKRRLVYYYTCL